MSVLGGNIKCKYGSFSDDDRHNLHVFPGGQWEERWCNEALLHESRTNGGLSGPQTDVTSWIDSFTITLPRSHNRQIACRLGCASELSVASEKRRKFPPVVRAHNPLRLRQSQHMFRLTNHKGWCQPIVLSHNDFPLVVSSPNDVYLFICCKKNRPFIVIFHKYCCAKHGDL